MCRDHYLATCKFYYITCIRNINVILSFHDFIINILAKNWQVDQGGG